MAHVFHVTIELSDHEYQTVGRAAAGGALLFHEHSVLIDWTVENELITLLRRAIADECTSQQNRDNIAKLLRYGAAPKAVFQPVPVPVPAWLEEMEATEQRSLMTTCRRCSKVHDITNRVTGDNVLCSCGASILVVHRARVVNGGGQ